MISQTSESSGCGLRFEIRECYYKSKSDVRITAKGDNKGKLYYVCRTGKCNYWKWCHPICSGSGDGETHWFGDKDNNWMAAETGAMKATMIALREQVKTLSLENVKLRSKVASQEAKIYVADSMNTFLRNCVKAIFVLFLTLLMMVFFVLLMY